MICGTVSTVTSARNTIWCASRHSFVDSLTITTMSRVAPLWKSSMPGTRMPRTGNVVCAPTRGEVYRRDISGKRRLDAGQRPA
jgi:hypothetical protein